MDRRSAGGALAVRTGGRCVLGHDRKPDGRLVLAFVLVVFVVILACGLIIRLMHAAVEWVGMGLFNRLAGAAFGLAKGAAVLVLATILIGLTPLSQLQAWQQAELRPELERLRDWSVGQLLAWEDRLPASASSLELCPRRTSQRHRGRCREARSRIQNSVNIGMVRCHPFLTASEVSSNVRDRGPDGQAGGEPGDL